MKAHVLVTVTFLCAMPLAALAGPASVAETAPQSQPASGLAPSPSVAAPNDLSVAVGQSVLVDTERPVTRVAIGLGDFAEVTAISPSEVLVNGKAPGATSLILWESGGGRQFFNVLVHPSSYVVADKLEGVRRELRSQLPGQRVRVTSANGEVFLSGTVKNLTSSDRAVRIASTAGKVVNLLYVDVPPSKPQILLKVRFASVDRSLEKQFGLNVFSLGATNSIGSVTTQQFSPPSLSSPGGSGPAVATLTNLLNVFIFRPDLNLGAALQALETRGLVQLLAEPNVLAADGKEASFLAGGEYPYPVIQGFSGGGVGGAVTIQFKEYGIRLNFIPTITPRNTIRLQVAPEVSALDFTNAVTISGFTVPAITARRVETEVELKNDQSFAIGGLLDNTESETFSKIPFIGDVPILGKFFQSIQRTKANTELIVIVTPEIVAPIPAGAPIPALHYPQKFLPPNSKIPMTNPGSAEATAPAKPTMPVEDLVESQKPEKPLITDQGGMGMAGSMGSSQGMAMTTGR